MSIRKHGIIKIPIEYYGTLISDPEKFIQEWCSIASGAIRPYFRDFHKVSAVVKDYENPINPETYAISSSFHAPNDKPQYAHIDLSISRDGCGFGMGHAKRFVPMAHREAGTGETKVLMVPFVHLSILSRLKPRPEFGEKEMNYEALLKIFIELDNRGFNLKEGLITLDRFQSHWLITALRSEGFVVGLLSVDHTTSRVKNNPEKPPEYIEKVSIPREPSAAMGALRDAMYQDRLETPQIQAYDSTLNWLQKESLDIEWDERIQKHKKIESHNASDDLIQAAAGTVFNCMNNTNSDTEELIKRATQPDSADPFYDQFDKNFLVNEGDMIDPEIGYIPDDSYFPSY